MSNSQVGVKNPHCDDDDGVDEGESESVEGNDQLSIRPRSAKVTRHEVELPTAEVDIRLAEKLDKCLMITDKRRSRFFTNKPKQAANNDSKANSNNELGLNVPASIVEGLDTNRLKPNNLSKAELRDRLLKKYDTLVPELDPNRPSVKLVKILSATESLEVARTEARKQLVNQMELNSIAGNQRALRNGVESFRFKDGYEMSLKGFYSKKFHDFQNSKCSSNKSRAVDNGGATTTTMEGQASSATPTSGAKSVKFADQHEASVEGSLGEAGGNKGFSQNEFFRADDDEDEDSLTDEDDVEDEQSVNDC